MNREHAKAVRAKASYFKGNTRVPIPLVEIPHAGCRPFVRLGLYTAGSVVYGSFAGGCAVDEVGPSAKRPTAGPGGIEALAQVVRSDRRGQAKCGVFFGHRTGCTSWVGR